MTNQENPFCVEGGQAASGINYLEVESSALSFCISAGDLANGGTFDQALAARQIIVTPKQKSLIVLAASEVRDYPPKDYAERGGWSGTEHYIQSNGRCISAKGSISTAKVVFSIERQGISEFGSHSTWLRNVAMPLTGQPLLQFLIMTAFAGPILSLTNRSLNILFEIVGPGGEGKSSAVAIAASTTGPAINCGAGTYWFTPNGTTNWLEQRLVAHADATAFMNEFQVFAASLTPAARANTIYDLIFRFSECQTRGRLDGIRPLTYRGVAVLTANECIRDVMAVRHAHVVNPTTSRLISLPGDAGFGQGTLDFLPVGASSARSFITSILAATERAHGTAMPLFLQGLVDMRARDDDALRQRIAEYVDEFITTVAGGSGGMHGRVAEAFAVVYVAGRLARHFGAIPDEWDPRAIARECYRRHLASLQIAEGKTTKEILRAYASRSDVIDLDSDLPLLTKEELKSASGFRRVRNGDTELYIPPATIRRLFPDWTRAKQSADVARFLRRDGKHLTVKKVVRQGGQKDRMHVFTGFV